MTSSEPFTLHQTETERCTPADLQEDASLRSCVEHVLTRYFEHLDGNTVTGLYQLVLNEVEGPLLEVVMREVRGNQSRAAEILGLNRGTLRKKLKQHDLL